jgi:hypothetical protein
MGVDEEIVSSNHMTEREGWWKLLMQMLVNRLRSIISKEVLKDVFPKI